MKNFKYIKILKSNPHYKLIETSDDNRKFLLTFEYTYDKIKVKLLSKFTFKGKTFKEKVIDCYKILTNKDVELKGEFDFINGEHVLNVSDCLYLLSKEIRKK